MREWMSRVRLVVLIIGFAAPALFIALILYAKFFTEGWGALALAPLVFPLFVASAASVVLGGSLYVARVRTRARDYALVLVVALNAALLWFANTHR